MSLLATSVYDSPNTSQAYASYLDDDYSVMEAEDEVKLDEEDIVNQAALDPVVKPLSAEALAAFEAAQARAGIVYISRIPPAMRPTKVRHLMNKFGEIGRIYLQQEDPKRAHLRRKFTSTKKAQYTEGWVEFLDKRVGRAVAEILNGQPIGGKKGSRWRDDVWTMRYLPRFKWNQLTEQVAHEAAAHTARLRVELTQSRTEQKDYLKNVELARVLELRTARKRGREDLSESSKEPAASKKLFKTVSSKADSTPRDDGESRKRQKNRAQLVEPEHRPKASIDDVLSNVF